LGLNPQLYGTTAVRGCYLIIQDKGNYPYLQKNGGGQHLPAPPAISIIVN